MEPLTEAQNKVRLDKAIQLLTPKRWEHVGDWRFRKNGQTYDLSATDLDMIDQLEAEGRLTIFARNLEA